MEPWVAPRMEPPAQHSGSITFCLAGNPNLTYEWRHYTPAWYTGQTMDTGTHALTLTCMGALLEALSFIPLLCLAEYLSSTHTTSTSSFQIPALNDRAWEQRKALELHSQTVGTVSVSCVTRVWPFHEALAYCSGLSLKIY